MAAVAAVAVVAAAAWQQRGAHPAFSSTVLPFFTLLSLSPPRAAQELNNGRLAMIAITLMVGQELITGGSSSSETCVETLARCGCCMDDSILMEKGRTGELWRAHEKP